MCLTFPLSRKNLTLKKSKIFSFLCMEPSTKWPINQHFHAKKVLRKRLVVSVEKWETISFSRKKDISILWHPTFSRKIWAVLRISFIYELYIYFRIQVMTNLQIIIESTENNLYNCLCIETNSAAPKTREVQLRYAISQWIYTWNKILISELKQTWRA